MIVVNTWRALLSLLLTVVWRSTVRNVLVSGHHVGVVPALRIEAERSGFARRIPLWRDDASDGMQDGLPDNRDMLFSRNGVPVGRGRRRSRPVAGGSVHGAPLEADLRISRDQRPSAESPKRSKRHHDDGHCLTSNSPTSIHCAYNKPGHVQLRMGMTLETSRQIGQDMSFGEIAHMSLELMGKEFYFIVSGKEMLTGQVGDELDYLLPCESQTFIVIKTNSTGHLQADFFVFYVHALEPGVSGVFLYNSLADLHLSGGVDVIGYSPELINSHPNASTVWRIGSNLMQDSLSSVEFPTSGFEFKTVVHGSVASQCDFQLVDSITSTVSVNTSVAQYFVTIAGTVADSTYSPRLLWCPSSKAPEVHVMRYTSRLVIMNAYRSPLKTHIYMPFNNFSVSFDYMASRAAFIALRQGDCVEVKNGNNTFRNIIQHDPITADSSCIAVPESRFNSTAIRCYLHCHSKLALIAPPGRAEVFMYNALIMRNSPIIDVIGYNHHGEDTSLLSVLKSVRHGDGQSVLLPIGHYEFKVVYNGSVNTLDEFHNARSLVQIASMAFQSQMSYYATLMGSDYEPEYPLTLVVFPMTAPPATTTPLTMPKKTSGTSTIRGTHGICSSALLILMVLRITP